MKPTVKKNLKLALAQWNIQEGDPDYNCSKLEDFATQAAEQKADILLVPEMWFSGYDYERFHEFSSDLQDGAFAAMRKIAANSGIAVAGSSAEKDGKNVYNTFTLFTEKEELLLHYRKLFLFGPMEETTYFTPGTTLSTANYLGWNIGAGVCYDLRFPELFRRMMNDDVHLFLLCAQWPVTRIAHWDLLLRARAVENQAFMAGCNRIGETSSYRFSGQSAVINFLGQPLVRADDSEGLWLATCDFESMEKYRRELPFLEDRKKEWLQ